MESRMITVACPECGAKIAVDEKYLGKRGRCNQCQKIIEVPLSAASDTELGGSASDVPRSAGDAYGAPPPAIGINPFTGEVGDLDGPALGTRFDPEMENPFLASGPEPAAEEAGAAANPAGSVPSAGSAPPVPKPETVKVLCPYCGASMRVPKGFYGRKGRCHRCRYVFRVAEGGPNNHQAVRIEGQGLEKEARPPSDPKVRAATSSPSHAGEARMTPPPAPKPALSDESDAPSLEQAKKQTDSAGQRVAAKTETPPARISNKFEPSSAPTAPLARPATHFAQLTIEAVEAYLINLPCIGTFVLAGGDYAQKGKPTPRVFVKLVGSNGVIGWGEVTPCPTWCYETSESIVSTIRNYLAPAIIGHNAWDRDRVCRTMERVIQPGATIGQPLAKSGIDTALHDMLARTLDIPLHVLFGAKRVDDLWLSYVVSGHSSDEAASQAQVGLEKGYTAFKIKVGMNDEATDRLIVEAVANAVPKGTYLWIDANQGYGLDAAARQAAFFGKLGVSAFEQPIKGSRISSFRQLVGLRAVPIAIDETLGTAADLIEYIKADAVDLPVAKVQRSGGHTHSLRFCAVAEAAGLRLLGSGLCESDLGLAHGAHLFAAHGFELPCDLNGRQFVDSAYVDQTVEIVGGRLKIPDRPGCGVLIDEEKLAQYVGDVSL